MHLQLPAMLIIPANIPGDLQSTTTMWKVKGSTSTEVPAKQAAQFYSGNVYLIHHSFKESGVQTHFLFIWQVYLFIHWLWLLLFDTIGDKSAFCIDMGMSMLALGLVSHLMVPMRAIRCGILP